MLAVRQIMLLFLVLLLGRAGIAVAAAREIALTSLIESLRAQGHNILYSSDLINSRMRVELETVSMEALSAALPILGLALRREGSVWVITEGERPAVAEVVTAVSPEPELSLENVIVTGSMHTLPGGGAGSSVRRFGADDLRATPSLAADVMRTTLRLPGMASVGISAKPRIRGGLQDELLIMQDGVELMEPFHLADYHSAFSTLDYYTVESVDIYTGGFPTRYGNRMSGVMEIANAWSDEEYNTNIGVSTFATFVNTRQVLAGERDGSWLLSYRRGDLSDLTDYIQTRSGDPKYQDGSARLNLALGERTALSIGAVYSEDDVEFEDTEESASSQIDTWYAWAQVDTRFSETLRSSWSLSWVDFQRDKQLRSFEDEAKGGLLDHQQDIKRLALRSDFSWWRSEVLHEFGWQLEYSDGDYRHISRIDRGELADIIDAEREVERDIELRPDGWSGGAYWAGEWELGSGWLLQPGLRWDFQDYYLQRSTDHQLSPRLGLAWEFSDAMLARLSVGRFYQPEGIQELQVLDGVTRFFPPQRSDQAIAGIEWRQHNWEFIGEAYFKRYQDTKGRWENMFNPFVLLPEMEPDRVELKPHKAQAWGVDLDLNYEIGTNLVGVLRYSYMQADDRIEGEWIPRRWSQEHTVNSSLSWRRDALSLSAAVTWHSGWRSSKLPAFVAEGEVVPIEDVLNNAALRNYFSLDVSARYGWVIGRTYLQVYADISNITDRQNQAGIDYDIDEEQDPGGFVITPDRETLLGRVSSVGITLSF